MDDAATPAKQEATRPGRILMAGNRREREMARVLFVIVGKREGESSFNGVFRWEAVLGTGEPQICYCRVEKGAAVFKAASSSCVAWSLML